MRDGARHAFYALGPNVILQSVEEVGLRTDGHVLALNSYENRVFEIGLEAGRPVVAKFYRPGRWSDAAILEEHAFAAELAALDIPVVPPLEDPRGGTLYRYRDYRFALFPLRGGRAPDLDDDTHLAQLGRFLGRIHAAGAVRPFRHRPALTPEDFGEAAACYLLDHDFLPPELARNYEDLAVTLLDLVDACFERAAPVRDIRLHGDCHPGNILWTDTGPHIVDLDDARTGPAVQDLWMFLSGDRPRMQAALDVLLAGYLEFNAFEPRELHLVEALRTLRMMHYAAWLARRWDDPAFHEAFPWFNTQGYWEEHILSLKEQAALMQEPPLAWEET